MSLLAAMFLSLSSPSFAANCVDSQATETTKSDCVTNLNGLNIWFNDLDGDQYNDDTVCCCTPSASCGSTVDGYQDVVFRTRVNDYDWGDCQDNDATAHPGASDAYYDGADSDCAGDTDFDQDNDGYYASGYSNYATVTPGTTTVVDDGSASLGADCLDTNASVHPGGLEVPNGLDDDCDGAADEGTSAYDDDGDCACEALICTGSVAADCTQVIGGDCDDSDPTAAPDLSETWYDGFDSDCDGLSDYDQDLDGFVDDLYLGLVTTLAGTGAVVEPGSLPGGDCDDTDAAVGPNIAEVYYDGLDADCATDDDYDQDGDGYVPTAYVGLSTFASNGSLIAGTGALPGNDCHDRDRTVNPGVIDAWYDGADDDCDLACDFDRDGDSFNIEPSQLNLSTIPDTLNPGTGAVVCAGSSLPDTDCDDTDALVAPDVSEVWYDGYDADCDGLSDYDQDFDGSVQDIHLGLATTLASSGAVIEPGDLPGGDCDDTNAVIGPAVIEVYYDGLDADCATDDDYDQDGDGYVPNAYVGLSTYASDGGLIAGTGGLPGGDCYDTDPAVHPGAADLWYDGLDDDCDLACDFDQDGDQYAIEPSQLSLSAIPDTIDPGSGAVVCPGTALPATDCVDSRAALARLDPNSPKSPADIHPDTNEVCETQNGIQIDDDCNGSTNTRGEGADEEFVQSGWGTPYYQDYDGDLIGNPEVVQYLCEPVEGFTTRFGDCDDSNADVNPDAPEICNNSDEDCDSKVDEASSLGAGSGCIYLYADQDLDGYGSNSDTTCLCYDGTSAECGDGYEFNDEDEVCYTRTSGDCYDFDSSIHPLADGEPLIEYADGNDNDCNGEIPLFELDCDDDGSLPLVATGIDPGTPIPSAATLGLTDCRGPSGVADADCCERGDCADEEVCDDQVLTEFVTCWGDYRLRLKCDEDTGLIVVNMSSDGVVERFDGGRRLYANARPCSSPGDCDDHCPARCPDAPEICDGVDNDCQGAIPGDADGDGLPDPLDEDAITPGGVNIAELDLDGDGYLGCAAEDLVDRAQDATSLAACGSSDALADCNDLCSLSNPIAEEERCDGFLNVCEGELEGVDLDRDQALTCGAWGGDDALSTDDVYLLVYVPTASGDSAAESGVVPLLLPRAEAPECDAQLDEALAGLVGQESLDEAVQAGDTEPLLRLCVAAEACRQIAEGASLPWPESCEGIDGACGVARLSLRADADDDAYEDRIVQDLDAVAECSGHPEQFITRTVWPRSRVLEARELVVQWDCFRLYGSYGCGDLTPPEDWVSPLPEDTVEGGGIANADPGEALVADARWWKELGRFNPSPMLQELLAGCWGDPEPGSQTVLDAISHRAGGDCADNAVGANRDTPEGPDDLVGIYAGEPADCETCIDGIDNNCNGLTDCAEPACARCFVGRGSGCGGDAQSPCVEGGCVSAPSRPMGAVALIGLALASALQMLRRRR